MGGDDKSSRIGPVTLTQSNYVGVTTAVNSQQTPQILAAFISTHSPDFNNHSVSDITPHVAALSNNADTVAPTFTFNEAGNEFKAPSNAGIENGAGGDKAL